MAPAAADACSPGAGWHVYNGQALGFATGRRWVDFIFVSPRLSVQDADQALGLSAHHWQAVSSGHAASPAAGWLATLHRWRGERWVVLERPRPKCAYIATPDELFKALGLRIIGAV